MQTPIIDDYILTSEFSEYSNTLGRKAFLGSNRYSQKKKYLIY